MTQTVQQLMTHSGVFHADDVFAAATLLVLFPNSTIIRTRDTAELTRGCASKEVVVFDVGDHFEPERHNFDHHQRGFERRRDNGVPYAAFGLVWEHFCRRVVESILDEHEDAYLQRVSDEVERRVVWAVDAADCGELTVSASLKDDAETPLSVCHVSRVVSMYNPCRDERRASMYDEAFKEAAKMAGVLIRAQVKRSHAYLQAEQVVSSADDGGPVVVLDSYVPWQEHVQAHHMFVTSPALDGSGWMVETVQDDYVPRKPLPESWAGLRDAELAEISGVDDAIFCHRARFITAAKSKQGALKLIERALASD